MAANRKVMERFAVRGAWLLLGWVATGIMALAMLGWLWSMVTGRGT
ncbi:MAG: hypothetical protein JOZ34_09095 [Gammaproteobacteria bacterium]|nr:hypothetical protein [Gammaproteobacteria bacterium]